MSAKTQAESAEKPDKQLLRNRVEQAVEHLLNWLDATEPDADYEASGNAEPWLGWTEADGKWGACDDREADTSDDESSCDAEAFCGEEETITYENHGNQLVLDRGEVRL